MVGLSDIPCVGVAVDKISVATVEAAIRGLRYMLCYKGLLNDLNSEIEKVKIQEDRVASKIVEAKDNGKIIEDHVMAWQGNVETVKSQADHLTRQRTSSTCFKIVHFPNPVSRFRLGREAAHLAKTVTKHTDSGRELLASEIAHYAPDENVPNSDTSYQSFASRQDAYEKLWNALVNNDGYPIIGIYGMPGAGKTRMVEHAWKELKEKKIFNKVIRANVGGEQLDVVNLQDQLSGYLNCHLQSKDNVVQRASQLKSSLMTEGQKILVILDDVWDVIPLNNIGIPFGDGSSEASFKILLTSRKKTVCLSNNCTDPIKIKALTDGEAWAMFRNAVGTLKVDSLEDSSLPKKVCKECGGLPLLIDAVGRSLKVLSENSWKDALNQLENCEFQEIDGIDTKVYSCLKFSFEKLAKGEKACILLCSFFPEDADIDVKMLFDMATGSQLLGSGRNIDGLVDILKSSSLLLEGKDVDKVKVHDIIRDVARSIATRDPGYAFLSLKCTSRLPDNEEFPTRRLLHLDLEGENVGFPHDLVCPDLHTLWMQSNKHKQQLSGGFFSAFMNLRVLLLQGKFLTDQQLTIQNLEKLRVLILVGCKISQTFLSSVSRNLETLCIRQCDLPSPLDLPEGKNLRKLELVVIRNRIQIVEKAISRLSNLKELIVPHGFKTRGDDDASISWELSQLSCLTSLGIRLNKLWHYPDRDIFSNLVEFNIHVGGYGLRVGSGAERKYLTFSDMHIEHWSMPLVERAEQLKLDGVTGLPNGFTDPNTENAFAKLKDMRISRCADMEHVASWEGRNHWLPCFTDLSFLDISNCHRLKFVFSSSVAKSLLKLQKLKVRQCPEIEEIIRAEDITDHHDGQEIIHFPNLESLIVQELPSLTSFCRTKVTFSSITTLDIRNLNTIDLLEEIERGSEDNFYSKLRRLSISYTTKQLLPSQFKVYLQNLEELELENCCWPGNSLFKGSLTFNTLKVLVVAKCPVSTLFTFKDDEEDERDDGANYDKAPISLLHLESLTLSDLPNLQNIGISGCYMPALVKVDVSGCGLITSLFTPSTFRNLQHLRTLKVSDCSLLKQIVGEEEEADATDDGTNERTRISLLHLQYVTLSGLPNLQNIGISSCYMPALVTVYVKGCGRITSLFTRSAFRNLQHIRELQVSDCSLLKEIVEEEEEDARDGTDEKTSVSLLHLESVTLSELPNLQNIGIRGCYMPTLVTVDVYGCGLITSLFTRFAFRNLQHLLELNVSACLLLEEIVEDEMDDATPGTSEMIISLPTLTSIQLMNLPRLGSFSSSSTCTFNMPALDSIYLLGCPHIKKFTSLPITAPSVTIYGEDEEERYEEEQDDDTSDGTSN